MQSTMLQSRVTHQNSESSETLLNRNTSVAVQSNLDLDPVGGGIDYKDSITFKNNHVKNEVSTKLALEKIESRNTSDNYILEKADFGCATEPESENDYSMLRKTAFGYP